LLLADPVSVSILQSLAAGPMEGPELIDRVENVSRSTYFERMRELEEISLIVRVRRGRIPPVSACELTKEGRCLLWVARLFGVWLERAPEGSFALGDAAATTAIKALALGWGSGILRWLAERPRSLTELEALVEGLGYRKLERAMRDLVGAGLAERVVAEGRIAPYAVTDWAREAVAPLAAAVRWERSDIPEHSAPLTAVEVEAGLLLALPLVRVERDMEGVGVLLVETEDPSNAEGSVGVAVRIAEGRAVWCSPGSEPRSNATGLLQGSLTNWLHAVIKGAPARLEAEGDLRLAKALLAGLHEALLGRPAAERRRLFESA
jgi:DNA-binding HxlR family transcriptional regulator